MEQPIYRYQDTESDLVDGALFVFVLATDPETFLQIEARKVNDVPQWRYALARFNSTQMTVYHKGHEVWIAPRIFPFEKVLDLRQPYAAIMLGRHPAVNDFGDSQPPRTLLGQRSNAPGFPYGFGPRPVTMGPAARDGVGRSGVKPRGDHPGSGPVPLRGDVGGRRKPRSRSSEV